MKLSLLEWIERSVLAVWEKIADFLAKDREARKAAPEHAADPLIIIPIPKNRTYLAFFGILMLFFILAGRTFYLQVFNNDFLQNEGEKALCAHDHDPGAPRRDPRPQRHRARVEPALP